MKKLLLELCRKFEGGSIKDVGNWERSTFETFEKDVSVFDSLSPWIGRF